MLDECKGEKFEELIAGFAVRVLKGVVVGKKGNADIVGGYGVHTKSEDLLPLVVSYRAVLQRRLTDRQELQKKAMAYRQALNETERGLLQRRSVLEDTPRSAGPTDLEKIKDVLSASWVGDKQWCNAILNRSRQESFSATIPVPMEFGLETDVAVEHKDPIAPRPLAEVLESRIQEHNKRLLEWEYFHRSLAAKEKDTADARAQREAISAPSVKKPRFTKHQQLHLGAMDIELDTNHHSTDSYQDLLRSLQEEIEFQPSTISSKSLMKRSSTESKPYVEKPSHSPYHALLDAVPQLPGQRLPLSRQGSASDNNEQSTLQYEETEAGHYLRDGSPQSDEATPEVLSIQSDKPQSPSSQPAETTPGISWIKDDKVRSSSFAQQNMLPSTIPARRTATTGSGMPANATTLAERTRLSLAMFTAKQPSEDNTHGIQHKAIDFQSDQSQTSPDTRYGLSAGAAMNTADTQNHDPILTLEERTRQSMSLLSTAANANRRQSQLKTALTSQTFPVNQFETPRKAQEKNSGWSPESDESTPREKLFDEGADYTSVFKSRPRIAVSPAMSPEKSGVDLDSVLEERLSRWTLDDSP